MSAKKKKRRPRQGGGDQELMSRDEVSGWTGLSVSAIDKFRHEAEFPFIQAGRRVLFRRGDVEKWLAKRSKNGEGPR